jgi:hypothetical protein
MPTRATGGRTVRAPLERRHVTTGFPVRLERRVVGTSWEPGCTCDTRPVPSVVLDPFAGAGTTLAVAAGHGRAAAAGLCHTSRLDQRQHKMVVTIPLQLSKLLAAAYKCSDELLT